MIYISTRVPDPGYSTGKTGTSEKIRITNTLYIVVCVKLRLIRTYRVQYTVGSYV